jgi:hypothetical protein
MYVFNLIDFLGANDTICQRPNMLGGSRGCHEAQQEPGARKGLLHDGNGLMSIMPDSKTDE